MKGVRQEIGERPLHVFGMGKPETARRLFELGVDSVDSSSYVKLAAEGRLWSDPGYHCPDPSPMDRMALALHNLAMASSSTGEPHHLRGFLPSVPASSSQIKRI